uniref:Secreted protein n=1 Tax=Anopheles quadriannulatus TaxID=34691 RepID=A0A182X6E9_ANOQN
MFNRKFVVVLAVLAMLVTFILAAPQNDEESIRFGGAAPGNDPVPMDTNNGADMVQEHIPEDQEIPTDVLL